MITRHEWSGWPGGICIKCGSPHAAEQALADGWWTLEDDWITEAHREYIDYLDATCLAEATEEEIETAILRAQELEAALTTNKEHG